jgi:hypothetical protein
MYCSGKHLPVLASSLQAARAFLQHLVIWLQHLLIWLPTSDLDMPVS